MPNNLNSSSRDEFQTLWSELPPHPRITPDDVRARARQLAADRRRRAIIGAVVFVLGIGHPIVANVFRARPLAWWEWALTGYLVAFGIVWLWMTRAQRRRADPALESEECVRSYRGMLERERDANRGRSLAARLSIPVFGLAIVAALNAWTDLAGIPLLPVAAVVAACCGFIWYRSRRRAGLFQTHIDLLNRTLAD
jgi:O-antigen/teichoic acid export membrane protein